MGGDSLETTIRLRKGTHGCLSTPSATSVYRALDCPASQRTDIVLEEEAILEYFPEHLIPYPQSALRQSLRVQMAAGSCVILSEAFAAGRIARREQWRFKELISDTEIRLGNLPIYINKSRIVPVEITPAALGVYGRFELYRQSRRGCRRLQRLERAYQCATEHARCRSWCAGRGQLGWTLRLRGSIHGVHSHTVDEHYAEPLGFRPRNRFEQTSALPKDVLTALSSSPCDGSLNHCPSPKIDCRHSFAPARLAVFWLSFRCPTPKYGKYRRQDV